MRRSHMSLVFALAMAAIAMFALPATASAQNFFNCEDFSSQSEAQAELDSGSGDSSNLDANADGVACEEFDYSGSTTDASTNASTDEYPRRGVASGGGSTARDPLSPLPLIASAAAFGLLAATSWGFGMRRRHGR